MNDKAKNGPEISDSGFEMNMEITNKRLELWRQNSIEVATDIVDHPELLSSLIDEVELEVVDLIEDIDVWYGACYYQDRKVVVVKNNITTQPIDALQKIVEDMGAPEQVVTKALNTIQKIGLSRFFEITNQSGMDHELIGHMYNYYANYECDEPAAVKMQLTMAMTRAGYDPDWNVLVEIMPIILGYHKDIAELK